MTPEITEKLQRGESLSPEELQTFIANGADGLEALKESNPEAYLKFLTHLEAGVQQLNEVFDELEKGDSSPA